MLGQHRRRRSSSVGGSRSPTKSDHDAPPIPPVPNNLRSTSAASNTSGTSARSVTSGSSRLLNSILHRSSSSLSKGSGRSFIASPTPSGIHDDSLQPSLPPPTSFRLPTPTSPSSLHPISRGYHVPSPSLNSPYHLSSPSFPTKPPLPHSVSYPAPQHADNDTESETSANGETPRRHRKPRPLSLQPPVREPKVLSRGFDGNGWGGFGDPAQVTQHTSHPSQVSLRQPTTKSDDSKQSPPHTLSSAWSKATRVGRSISRHSRKLSDTFRQTSTTTDQDIRRSSQTLETVHGSPVKTDECKSRPKLFHNASEDIYDARTRGGSASAPSSAFRSNTVGRVENMSVMVNSISQDSMSATSEKKKKRRSDGGLIIPDSIVKLSSKASAEKATVTRKVNLNRIQSRDVLIIGLIRLVEDTQAIYQGLKHSGRARQHEIDMLCSEYDPLYMRATAIIDWSFSGETPTTAQDSKPERSTTRDRRVTLASDQAKANADTLAILMGGADRETANRSISLPDPSVGPMEEETDLAEGKQSWRDSIGRQASTRQRMTMYEAMGDIRPVRPGLLRGSSTVSASSSHGILPRSVSKSHLPARQFESGSSFISSSKANDMRASGPFASPTAASTANVTRPQNKSRRSGKTGLAALIVYLKSIKKQHTPEPSHNSTAIVPDSQILRPTMPRSSATDSPLVPLTSGVEEIPYPTARSTASIIQSQLKSPPEPSSSPQKSRRRARIPKFLRSTSGNWSSLPASSSPAPPVPGQPKTSFESSSDREIIPGLPGRSNARRTTSRYEGVAKPSKTPTSASFNFASKIIVSSDKKSNDNSVVRSQSTIRGEGISEILRIHTSDIAGGHERDRTVRAAHKSRLDGLGRPSSPSSPISGRTPKTSDSSRKSDMILQKTTASDTDRMVSDSTDWSFFSDETAGTAITNATERSETPKATGIPWLDEQLKQLGKSDMLILGIEGLEHLIQEQKDLREEMLAWKQRGEEWKASSSSFI